MKGHKVTTSRKLSRAQELIKQDKQQYWNKRKGYTKRSTKNNNTRHQQINEVDDNASIDEVENQEEDIYDQDSNEMDDINFPTSDLTKEEDQAYYYDNWLNLEHIEEIVNSSVHPQALYRTCSNGHNFIAKVDSGASRNCISKSLWNRIKVSNKLAKPNVILTGAGGSKLSLLGFSEITCSIGKFTFTEEFAVIEGMVSDMLLGIKWEHKFNIHTGWTQHGNHYISRGKHDFIAESMNRLKTHPIIKMKGKVELNPESIALVEVQAPRDIIGNKKYQLNPEGYLPQGIIPLDLVHSFDKTHRTLYVPILNTSTKYESIAKGSLLGMFEPIDEEVSEIQVTSWTDLEGKMQKVHQQLRKKKSYRQARQKCYDKKEETVKLLPDYPANSNMEMEAIMKQPDTKLRDAIDADKWKIKVLNMLESRFGSIISRSQQM